MKKKLKQEIFMIKKKDKYIHIKNVFVWFGILPITTFFLCHLIMKLGNTIALWLGTYVITKRLSISLSVSS